MATEKFLIAHDFHDTRFFRREEDMPYEFTSALLRDELVKRAPGLDVVWSRSEDETLERIVDADFLAVADELRRSDLNRGERLRWVHLSSSGADHCFKVSDVDPDYFRGRGIIVTISPGAVSVVIAEQVLCFMGMFSRNMLRALRQQRERHWERYHGGELSGMTMGIIGLGAIGSATARLSKCYGMRVIGTDPNPSEASRVADEVWPPERYPQVLEEADFVLLACPITEETRTLINAETLRLMKPTAYLLNVGRGECVDEAALVHALKNGVIAGYASDNHGDASGELKGDNLELLSPDSELWNMENVIITPNCAEAGPRRYVYMADIIANNYHDLKAHKEPRNRLVWDGKPV